MTGQDISDEMSSILSDPDSITWEPTFRLQCINGAIRDIATHKPKSTTVSRGIQLVAANARQAAPDDAVAVLDVTCNLGEDGATPGRAITPIAAERLQASAPNWRREQAAAVRHFIADDRDPRAFYVWPSPQSAVWVEGLLHLIPQDIADLGTAIPLDASYRNAVLEYALHMAYAKDAENPNHAQLSIAHYQKYAATMGIQVEKQKRASSPANSPSAPNHPAVDKHGA